MSRPTYLTLHWCGPRNKADYLYHAKSLYDNDVDDDVTDLVVEVAAGLKPGSRLVVNTLAAVSEPEDTNHDDDGIEQLTNGNMYVTTLHTSHL